MRTVTFSNAEVTKLLDDHFDLYWTNQLPELFRDPKAPPKRYPEAQMAQFPEGGGGGNVRVFVCTRDGRIVHHLRGYWSPERLLDELRFALALVEADAATIAAAHGAHVHEGGETPLAQAQQNLLRRCHDETEIHAPVCKVLRRIEEEVFTRGAVG